MRLLVQVGDDIIQLYEMSEEEFEKLEPRNLRGVPTYWCQTQENGLELWPAPLKFCEIWRKKRR